MLSETNPRETILAPRRLSSLQILRFLAALAVVFYHLTQFQFGAEDPPFRIGAAGVDVFFVLSGFIIGYSSRHRPDSRDFMRRRIARVVPIYWAATIALFCVAAALPALLKTPPGGADELLKSLFFIPYVRGNGLVQPVLFLGWTLNYEMFFYVAFAVAMAMTHRYTPVISILFAGLVLFGAIFPSSNVIVRFYTSPILFEFLYGLWIYEAYARRPEALERLWPLALVGLAALLVQNFVDVPAYRPLWRGVPAALVVIGALSVRVPQNWLCDRLVELGDASYSMYLLHPYVIQLGLRGLQPQGSVSIAVAWAVILAAIAGLSLLSYRYFERPIGAMIAGRPRSSRPDQA